MDSKNVIMDFTLVSTTFNEIRRLDESIREIEAQAMLPSQIIIVDAGSNDGTYERLISWKDNSQISIEILSDPGCNVAEGRNLAISKATNCLIVSTDFGCRYHPEWLKSLITPFITDPILEVVGGSFTVKEEDIVNIAQKADYILQNGYKAIMDDRFSVSSRSIAYNKQVWEKIGGYPESLTLAADDTIFWRKIKSMGFRYSLIDKPYVYWTRHQTFKGFGKEAKRYGLGDGESGINQRSFFSNAGETLLRYSALAHLIILPFYIGLTIWPALFFIVQLAGLRSYKNAVIRWWNMRHKFGTLILISCFQMIEVTRVNYIVGYLKGWTGRDKNQQELAQRLRAEIS